MYRTRYQKEQTAWRITVNDKRTDIKIYRIKNSKEHVKKLVKIKEMQYNLGYFKYNEKMFTSHLMSINFDLLFVNKDGRVIELIEDFPPNHVTKYYDDTKFLYILRKGLIKQEGIKYGDIIRHQKWKRRG